MSRKCRQRLQPTSDSLFNWTPDNYLFHTCLVDLSVINTQNLSILNFPDIAIASRAINIVLSPNPFHIANIKLQVTKFDPDSEKALLNCEITLTKPNHTIYISKKAAKGDVASIEIIEQSTNQRQELVLFQVKQITQTNTTQCVVYIGQFIPPEI